MKRRDFIRSGLPAAPALLSKEFLAPQMLPAAYAPLSLDVRADQAGRPLDHYWSRRVAAGRANEGLRGNWQEQLKLCVDACGFKYLRFHGLFHDDMLVYPEKEGRPVYNWQYVDDLYEVAERTLATGEQRSVDLRLLGLAPGASFVVETLDAHQGFSFRSWQEMGSPEPPAREQEMILRQKAMATAKERISVGRDRALRWTNSIEPWAVVAIYQD